MSVIQAEYEEVGKEGIIRLWPPCATLMEGKRLAAKILDAANRDEVLELEHRVGDLEEELDDVRDDLRTAHRKMYEANNALRKFCEAQDPAEFTKDKLQDLLKRLF
jgi:hypothetical protein